MRTSAFGNNIMRDLFGFRPVATMDDDNSSFARQPVRDPFTDAIKNSAVVDVRSLGPKLRLLDPRLEAMWGLAALALCCSPYHRSKRVCPFALSPCLRYQLLNVCQILSFCRMTWRRSFLAYP
jgi:hypothetical protein